MTWLLLRGLSREQRHWGTFPEELERATGEKTLCLDLPGFGTENARTSPRTIALITDDLRRRLEKHRGTGSWSILGVSLGGMIALDWCARHPSDFERCVTINTSARPSWPLERFRLPGLRAIAGAFTSDPIAKERITLRTTSNKPHLELDALAVEHAKFLVECPPTKQSLAFQLRAASKFAVPAKMTTPVLLLASRTDRLVSYRCSERIARTLAQTAELMLHDRGGHDLPLDEPAWICERIAAWTKPRDH